MEQLEARIARLSVPADFNERDEDDLVRTGIEDVRGFFYVGASILLEDADDGVEVDGVIRRIDRDAGLLHVEADWTSARPATSRSSARDGINLAGETTRALTVSDLRSAGAPAEAGAPAPWTVTVEA